MFKYEIYDNDVGDNIHEESDISDLIELSQIVKRDLDYDFEADIEFEDNEDAFRKELAYWDPHKIVLSLMRFNFINGFAKWHCRLPGGHRELIVSEV